MDANGFKEKIMLRCEFSEILKKIARLHLNPFDIFGE